MKDLNKKTVADLRGICAEQGLPAYGTKAVLIERIENAAAKSLKKEIVEEEKIYVEKASTSAPIEIIKEKPKEIKTATSVRRAEIDSIIGEVNAFFAGRAECTYHDESNMICFRGGSRIAWDVTPNQPMKSIMHFARAYVARADNRQETIGKVGGAF